MKKLLFTRESACLQPIRELIERQKHRTLVMWAIECAGRILPIFEDRHPEDPAPAGSRGSRKGVGRAEKLRCRPPKRAAHAAHNAATEVSEDAAAYAAARAMGHAVGTVHVETHAMGVVMYGLTAFVYEAGLANAEAVIPGKCKWFYDSFAVLGGKH